MIEKSPVPPRSVVENVFRAPGGDVLSLDEAVASASGADYVLLGEGHSSECDHTVQRVLVRALAEGANPPVVGFEMISEDRQPVLDAFNRGEISLEDLPEELEWGDNWGYPFELYAPIFDAAHEKKLPVVALNLPFKLARKAGDGVDGLSDEERAQLPKTIVQPPAEQEELLMATLAMHMSNRTGSPEKKKVDRFFLIQSIWDSQMAERAAEVRSEYGRPVVVIVGGGHVEYGWGIAHRLKLFDPGAEIFQVMPWRGPMSDSETPEVGKADLFFFCAPSHRSRLGMVVLEKESHAVVTKVEPDSRADRAGLRAGDVIIEANGLEVTSLMDLHRAGSRAYKEKQPLTFVVRRGNETLTVDLGLLGQGRK